MNSKITIILMLFISACGSKNSSEDGNATDSTVANVDSTKIEMSTEMNALVSKFKVVDAFPINIDSVFINGVSLSDSIRTNEVKLITTTWFKNEISLQQSYEIKTFFEIDSIKKSGNYAKYVDGLDIGMIKSSNVYSVANFKIDEKTMILIWALQYMSYEACPYSAGTTVYATILKEGVAGETMVVGETMVAADAPVGMHRFISSKIEKNGNIAMELYEENTDGGEEEETIESHKEHYKYEIVDGKLKTTFEKKDKPKIEIKKYKE